MDSCCIQQQQRLHGIEGVRYGLFHPSRLHITRKGVEKDFVSAEEASDYVKTFDLWVSLNFALNFIIFQFGASGLFCWCLKFRFLNLIHSVLDSSFDTIFELWYLFSFFVCCGYGVFFSCLMLVYSICFLFSFSCYFDFVISCYLIPVKLRKLFWSTVEKEHAAYFFLHITLIKLFLKAVI